MLFRSTGDVWQYAQQKETLNQAPLFDLFDENGNSFGNKDYYLSDFIGNKIFSYTVGSGTTDPYLEFPISYKTVNTIGSILFDNNLCTDTITVSQLSEPTVTFSSNSAYIKISNEYKNAWTAGVDYSIPLLSSTATGILSYFEEPLSLTNNPLNGTSKQFTISELTQHVQSMVDRLAAIENFTALRDQPEFSQYGTLLITSDNPISFAQMFLGQKEHDLIFAIQRSAENYNNFKNGFIKKIEIATEQMTPVEAVDLVLSELNQDKVYNNSYYLSDMVGYGVPEVTRTWTVNHLTVNNPSFPLSDDFDITKLSNRAV